MRKSSSMSRPGVGRTWIVTSRPTSDCQSLAAFNTTIAAPVVSAARKVMMATTAVSERPAIEFFGTIGAAVGTEPTTAGDAARSSHGSAMVSTGSIIDMKASLMQNQSTRVVFVHQCNVVGGNDDCGP